MFYGAPGAPGGVTEPMPPPPLADELSSDEHEVTLVIVNPIKIANIKYFNFYLPYYLIFISS